MSFKLKYFTLIGVNVVFILYDKSIIFTYAYLIIYLEHDKITIQQLHTTIIY